MKKTLILTIAILAAQTAICANSFTGIIFARPTWEYTKTGGASTLSQAFGDFVQWRHADGTNAYQMTTIILDTATLTNSQTRTVSLGAIADGFGDVRAFHTVRFVAVQAASNNVDNVRIGGAATDPFSSWVGDSSDAVNVAPGGLLMIVAPQLTGYPVGTSTNLLITNTGTNDATYFLYVGGNE